MSNDDLTDDDRAKLIALHDALAPTDPMRFVSLLHEYYGDADRADRTPRAQMYLHLGMLSGLVMKLLAPR